MKRLYARYSRTDVMGLLDVHTPSGDRQGGESSNASQTGILNSSSFLHPASSSRDYVNIPDNLAAKLTPVQRFKLRWGIPQRL